MSKQDSPKIIGPDGWSFEGSWGARRGGFPTLGALLIVFGLLLVAGQFFTWAEYGTGAFVLALGLVLIVSGLRDRSDLALYAGVFLAALGASDLLTAGNVIKGDGWGTLFVGVGFMAASLMRSWATRRIGAAFVLGVILAVWGGIQVAQNQFSVPLEKLTGPVLLILLGLWIVGRRSRADRY